MKANNMDEPEEKEEKKSSVKDVKTSKHASRYLIIGVILTIFSYTVYTIIARIINNNELLWLATLIATVIATFLAYLLHSKITWKERYPGKLGIYKFFAWNFFVALAVAPFLTWLFGLMTPVYEFAYSISSAMHLPFDYDFVHSTGAFCFTTVVTMTLNFIFYDRLVFGKKKEEE